VIANQSNQKNAAAQIARKSKTTKAASASDPLKTSRVCFLEKVLR